MTQSLITMPELKKIRNGHPLTLEYYNREIIDIPKLWLFYDINTSSYILVRRTYDAQKRRIFNHVILDDSLFEYSSADISIIFQEAIEKIKSGKCFVFQANKTFSEASCDITHK